MAPKLLQNPMRSVLHCASPSRSPLDLHRSWPNYAPTELHDLDGLAEELGFGRLLLKDESRRLGQPSFKILGASWAIYRALAERLGGPPQPAMDFAQLVTHFESLRPLTLTTATTGNHGRAVAHVARLVGFPSRIFVPESTNPRQAAAIRAEGAEVVFVPGGYDDAVRRAVAASGRRELLISDTSWRGYEMVPQWIMNGYSTILWEIDEQMSARGAGSPDVVIVPIGVGALAAAVARHYRQPGLSAQPILAGVEPEGAACVTASMLAGRIVSVTRRQPSLMAGLDCETPSWVAWPYVSSGFDWMVIVSDREASSAVRILADRGIASGPSGAASLAAVEPISSLLTVSGRCPKDQTVLVLSTEGVTEPLGL